MTADEDRTILLIGSGPIKIGQAAEFDYSGAQACRALQEEGARVVLVNSNPATIMTDPEMADKVYLEPINTEAISEIIRKEDPDGVIAGLGGQTGLNVTAELAEEGVLDEYDVDVMGTPLDTIYATEDRDLFKQRMEDIGEPVPRSTTITLDEGESVTDLDEESLVDRVEAAVDEVGGLPVIARTTYTLGGSGSGVVDEMDELIERVRKGLRLSRNNEVLITESISGWVELEYEVMRDADDSCIIICNMENIDPMGIHTGESTVVTPSQVIPDEGHQEMRDSALKVIRDLGIQGGCNIQFAWHDDGTPGGEYRVVEVNPRVSRSSALASKATGYPIARVTAKVALGKRLHEIENEITGETTAAFEPAIDYVVTKVPRWPIDKFRDTEFELSTAMKSTGEAMSIGRTFPESLLKALRSSEYNPAADFNEIDDAELETEYLEKPTPDRPYAMFEAFCRGYTVEEVVDITNIKEWYVERFKEVADAAQAAREGDYETAAQAGFTDQEITALAGGEFNDTHVSWLPADLDEDGELLAVLGVFDRKLEDSLGPAQRPDTQLKTPDVQDVEGDLVALADLAEDIFLGDFDLVEVDLTGRRAVLAHLVLFGAQRDAVAVGLHQKGREFVALDLAKHRKQIGEPGVGDPHLRAGDLVGFAAVDGFGLRLGRQRVRPATWLGQGIGADRFGRSQFWKPFLFLLFGAEVDDRLHADAGLSAVGRREPGILRDLLHHQHGRGLVDPEAAVLFGDADTHKPQFRGLVQDLDHLVEVLLLEVVDPRIDLLVHEVPHRGGKHLLLLGELLRGLDLF